MRTRSRVTARVSPDRWLVSYADFITLLFAFFVMMYAISSVDARKLQVMTRSMRGAFDEARKGYQEILALWPNHAGAHHFLGVLAYQQGEHAKALALFDTEAGALLKRIADGKPGISGPRFPRHWTRFDYCPG